MFASLYLLALDVARAALGRVVAAEETTQQASPWGSLIFFGLIFVAMYFLLLRPQRRRMRESQQLQRDLSVDDEVVLSSGLIGFVTALEEMDGSQIAWIDIAQVGDKPVEVRVLRSSIARRIVAGEAPAAQSKPATK